MRAGSRMSSASSTRRQGSLRRLRLGKSRSSTMLSAPPNLPGSGWQSSLPSGCSIARRVQVEHLGMSVLGVVPRCGRDGDKKGSTSPDAVVEAFRGIRLNLLNAYGAAGPIVVAVTSPGSGDGKSFVSSNLALAFAYANHCTLLVDADLRRGALHRALNLPRRGCLSRAGRAEDDPSLTGLSRRRVSPARCAGADGLRPHGRPRDQFAF